jgi:hypothetical protein
MSLNLPNLSNLTETAQKNLTAISSKISIQKKIIEKERAVLDTKGDTYVCSRARTSLAFKKSKLDKLGEEIEEKKNKLKEEFNKAMKQLDRDLEVKSRQLESEIEIQEKIIWDETHRETPTTIRANKEIEMLTKEKEKLLNAVGVFTTEQPLTQPPTLPTPPHTLPENERVCVATPKDIPAVSEQSIDFALFMMDGRQDGKPIDPNPSYLSGVALGLCMTKSDKVKKGIKMP